MLKLLDCRPNGIPLLVVLYVIARAGRGAASVHLEATKVSNHVTDVVAKLAQIRVVGQAFKLTVNDIHDSPGFFCGVECISHILTLQ